MTDDPTTTNESTHTQGSTPVAAVQVFVPWTNRPAGEPSRRDLYDLTDDAPPSGTAFRSLGVHLTDDEPTLAVLRPPNGNGAAPGSRSDARPAPPVLPPKVEPPHPLGARHQRNEQERRNQRTQQQQRVRNQVAPKDEEAPRIQPDRAGQPVAPETSPASNGTSPAAAVDGRAPGQDPGAKSAPSPDARRSTV